MGASPSSSSTAAAAASVAHFVPTPQQKEHQQKESQAQQQRDSQSAANREGDAMPPQQQQQQQHRAVDTKLCLTARDGYFDCMSKATDPSQCDDAFAAFEQQCPEAWRRFFYQQRSKDIVIHSKVTEKIAEKTHAYEGLKFFNAKMYP